MSWNLNSFRKNVKSVGLNQYFQIDIPQLGVGVDRITALVRTTELPAMVHETTGIPYRGLDMKIQTKVSFNDWNVTILCENDHAERKLMLEWQAIMYKLDSLANEAHDVYKKDDVTVAKVGYNGEVIEDTRCQFYGIFPTQVGAVSLDQSGGQPDTFDVTFSYDYFTPANGTIPNWSGKANG